MQGSELYEEYKSQFISNCQELESISPQTQSDKYGKLIKDTDLLLKHILIEMQLISKRQSAQELLKLQPYRKQFQRRKKQWESNNKNLIISGSKMNIPEFQQNQKLSECKTLLYGMEDTTAEINKNLHSQSEKIMETRDRAKRIGKVLDGANTILDRMIVRENRKKFTISFVLIGVVLIVAGLKYCCY